MSVKRFWYDFEDCNGHKMVDFEQDKEYSLETVGDFWEIENLLNKLHDENQEYKNKIKKIEEIIDNRLDKNVRPKWQDNRELFIEEKVGYWFALEQLKKKLIRANICFEDVDIEDI